MGPAVRAISTGMGMDSPSLLADPSGAVAGGQALAESQLPEDTDPVGTSEVSDEVCPCSQLKALPLRLSASWSVF